MDEAEFEARTRQLAFDGIVLAASLPGTVSAGVIGRQRIRSITPAGANYRAACRGLSPMEVMSRLSIVDEEADESLYWIELLGDSGLVPESRLERLLDENEQILRVVVASRKTLKSRLHGPGIVQPNRKSKIENRK